MQGDFPYNKEIPAEFLRIHCSDMSSTSKIRIVYGIYDKQKQKNLVAGVIKFSPDADDPASTNYLDVVDVIALLELLKGVVPMYIVHYDMSQP